MFLTRSSVYYYYIKYSLISKADCCFFLSDVKIFNIILKLKLQSRNIIQIYETVLVHPD